MRRHGPTRLSRRPATQAVLGTILGGFLLAAGIPSAAQQAGAAPTADPRATPATPATPAGTAGAPLLEPYRFNARERTSRALAAWEKGRPEDAVAPLDSALRLQPGDPLVEFNAGTAHLGAKQPTRAFRPRTPAARSMPTRVRCARSPIWATPSAISSSRCGCSKNSNVSRNSSRKTSRTTRPRISSRSSRAARARARIRSRSPNRSSRRRATPGNRPQSVPCRSFRISRT